MIEITKLVKAGGPLTKQISLSPGGTLISDGSACVMSRGSAYRTPLGSLDEFADMIGRLSPSEAIALGALRSDLPDHVEIATKERLAELNGHAGPGVIARTAEHISYRPDHPALALIDIDTKGMPSTVADLIDRHGGVWRALLSAVPALAHTAHVIRRSTSTGISRTDTGEVLEGSNGAHIFLLIRNGADTERFLRTFHDRCWLAGFGWSMVGAGGQLLERSLVDRMVYAAERLVFEGAPVLVPPLVQDQARRTAKAVDGEPLDTIVACPPLGIAARAELEKLHAQEAHRLAPDRAKAREKFVTEHSARVVTRSGIAPDAARRMVEKQCGGILLPEVVLPFDASEFEGITVGQVLADPERFVGATLADPLEGVEYGRGKAKIMRRASGELWIHSFAHGRIVYELKHDAVSAEALLTAATDADAVQTFVRIAAEADLTPDEQQHLRDATAKRAGVGKRTIDKAVETVRREKVQRRREEEQQRQAAERRDPRPQIPNPAPDAPWLPQMEALNDILGRAPVPEPPMRGLSGHVVEVRVRRVADMHALTAQSANDGEPEETRLPPPEQPLLTDLDDIQLAEAIERHIDYIDPVGRSVHLSSSFVKHFLVRHDGALPVVSAVATLPMVLPDGGILSGDGLNRERGIVFRIPRQLQALLPTPEACTPSAVAEAMRYLTDEWLCDVATDYAGKCVLIAGAGSLIERHLLPERPAFFVSAGQRGGGKTTAANMVSCAVLGTRVAAAAWSSNEEERRKAMLAYLGEGVPLICWDNIPRGATIGCPSIEKALTAATYADRVLGVSELRTVPATSVHMFTGNNIAPRGDLASRSLSVRLNVDRPDPENRQFRHPDPFGWTEAHRGEILRALYTVMLGNPRLRQSNPPAAETRFKAWWHVVGSAVEHAARIHAEHVAALAIDGNEKCPARPISFRAMLQDGEADEEQTSALATVLGVLATRWAGGFKASDASVFASRVDEEAIEFKNALEQASGKAIKVVTPTVLTWRLKAIMDAPVEIGGKVMALRYQPNKSGDGGDFKVVGTSR